MPIECWFYYYNSVVQIVIRNGDTSSGSFIIQGCFSYPAFSLFVCFCLSACFHRRLRNAFSISLKNCVVCSEFPRMNIVKQNSTIPSEDVRLSTNKEFPFHQRKRVLPHLSVLLTLPFGCFIKKEQLEVLGMV